MADRHALRLQKTCRVCGAYCKDINPQRACKAVTYHKVLSLIFGMNVLDDSPTVHPERLCLKCSVLIRHAQSVYNRRKKKITASDIKRQTPNVFKFERCSGSSCRVCNEDSKEPGVITVEPCSSTATPLMLPAKSDISDILLDVGTVEPSTSRETPLMPPAQFDISDRPYSSGLLQPLDVDTVEPSTSTATPLMLPTQTDISDILSSTGLLQPLDVVTVVPSTNRETPLMSPAQSDISDTTTSSGFSLPEMPSHKRLRSDSESSWSYQPSR